MGFGHYSLGKGDNSVCQAWLTLSRISYLLWGPNLGACEGLWSLAPLPHWSCLLSCVKFKECSKSRRCAHCSLEKGWQPGCRSSRLGLVRVHLQHPLLLRILCSSSTGDSECSSLSVISPSESVAIISRWVLCQSLADAHSLLLKVVMTLP